MDIYAKLNMEKEKLEALAEDRIKRGLPINDEIILAQNKIVDELANRVMKDEIHEQ